MSTTTSPYGTWTNHGDRTNTSVEATVTDAVSGGPSEWLDRINTEGYFDGMVAAYRNAINAALPGDVALCGDDFIGPWQPEDGEFDGYPKDEYGGLDIAAIISGIDLAPIVERHDPDLINQDGTLGLGPTWHTLTIGHDTVIDLPVRANEVIPAALLHTVADQALTEAGWEHTGPWSPAGTAPLTLA